MKRHYILKALLLLTAAIGSIAGFVWYHAPRYPFGWSHCCDKALCLSLWNYAESHDGAFPAGEATPEASLSLLYKANLADANLLRGKSVAEETVQEILDRGELLGPDSCGWHYVEGLRKDDDGRLAVFWDKAGLGHNGEVLPKGGHRVGFVSGFVEYIPASGWPNFLTDQEQLHKKRMKDKSDSEND